MSSVTIPQSDFTTVEGGVEIAAVSDSQWKARVVFASRDVSDREMIMRMREVKLAIAKQFTAPLELLEFREVLEKVETKKGVSVIVAIGRISVGKGKSVLRMKPMKAPNGETFMDMAAEVDFYYLDEFDQKVSVERLLETCNRWGLVRELLDLKAISEAVDRVLENRSLVTHLEIARGKFPEPGRDAELEYTFFTEPDAAQNLSEYRSSRKVKEGDVLCQKIPPQDGKTCGHGVLGQVIPPGKGLDVKLLAGDGTKRSLDGTRITALRPGMAVMTRTVRKIYTATGKKIVPSQIEVSVKELTTMRGSQALNLAVDTSVEITGSLPQGASIVAAGEVYVEGDVEPGARVKATQDVMINGQISGHIASDASILGRQGALNANLQARDTVELAGSAENSDIRAETVKLLESLGSRIMASYKVQLSKAKDDTSGRRTTIRVGRKGYYNSLLKANEEEVQQLVQTLEKIGEFFGKEVLHRAHQEPLQRLFLEQLETLQNSATQKMTHDQAQSIKKLLEAIKPLRNILEEKRCEKESLLQKATEDDQEKPLVIIREKIQDPVEVTINEVTQTLEPTPDGVVIAGTNQASLLVRALDAIEKEDSLGST
jgi:uncharacterized protein (DUF342 family)